MRLEILLGTWAAVMVATRFHKSTPWDGVFDSAAADEGVDPDLLKAIATWEHRNTRNLAVPALEGADAVVSKPNANGTRDYGVLQINLNTWAKFTGLDADSAVDAESNIRAGARILAELRKELKDHASLWTLAAAWNAGAPRVYRDGPGVVYSYAEGVVWHYFNFKAARIVYLDGAL